MSSARTTVGALAAVVGGEVEGDPERAVRAVAPLDAAGPEDVSFLTHPRYRDALARTRAGAVVIGPADAHTLPGGRPPHTTFLVCAQPYLAVARIAALLAPEAPRPKGAHPRAHVDPAARVDPTAWVGPGAVVEADAEVGPEARIDALAYVGPGAVIGADTHLHPGAKVLAGCRLGRRVILQAGAVVGADGFGYAVDAEGVRHRIPQLGTVVLEDDVEVGANTTIDRATFGETRIGRGTKLDNLVQIAHNVRLGRDCVVVSQSGIAGSTRTGDRVVMGAQSGMIGHIEVGDDVTVGARGALGSDTPEAGAYSGAPAVPHRRWLRTVASLNQLPELRRRIGQLEARLIALWDRVHDGPGVE